MCLQGIDDTLTKAFRAMPRFVWRHAPAAFRFSKEGRENKGWLFLRGSVLVQYLAVVANSAVGDRASRDGDGRRAVFTAASAHVVRRHKHSPQGRRYAALHSPSRSCACSRPCLRPGHAGTRVAQGSRS